MTDSAAQLQNHPILVKESNDIRALLAKEHFHHFTDRQCSLTIKKTKYRCLRLKIDILDGYPQSNLVIEITSQYLDARLLKKLRQGINAILESNAGRPRIDLVVRSLHDIIENNRLTVAFDEVHQVKKLFKHNQTVKLEVHETNGRIKFDIDCHAYKSQFVLTVPELYPLDAVKFRLKTCSFPRRYQSIYTQQALNICDKLSKGFDIDYILSAERTIVTRNDTSAVDAKEKEFTASTAVDIRNDLKTMHKMSTFHNECMDKKSIRRRVRVLNKQALQEEKNEHDARKQLQRACIDPNQSIAEPRKSLLICAKFLFEQFTDLPLKVCSVCKANVFPANPQTLLQFEEHPKKYVNKNQYPQRVNCGCWFHHKCLDTLINTPPFGKDCERCKVKLKHPLFETDVKMLEKQWAVKQAKERELDDIDEFVNDLFN